jgi:hypothetical protein
MIGPMSRLCLSCGLCCSGPIFNFVPVLPHDDVASLEAGGITVSISGGKHRFDQPCPAHDGAACRIYANRPAACRQYRCDLLSGVEDGRIDSGEALRLVGEAVRLNRQLTRAIEEIAPGDCSPKSRAGLPRQFSERLEQTSEPETRRRLGSIVVQILALDEFVRRHFGASALQSSEPDVDAKS